MLDSLYSIYLILFPIYIFVTALAFMNTIYTIFKIQRLSKAMMNSAQSFQLDSILLAYVNKFEIKNVLMSAYFTFSGVFAGITFVVFYTNIWLCALTLFLWSIARVSMKILNIINVGFYFGDIFQSFGQFVLWLPYFVIHHLHGFNVYKINGFIEYLNASQES